MSKHEKDIDQKILELRTRAWDLAIYYCHNCTVLGSAKFFEMLHYLAGQSAMFNQVKQNTIPIPNPTKQNSFV